ncbi:MAG: TonB-dependent receptor [Tannerellaceae bacterium]|jgi:TonB-linked SusC/RagA family outer membrane protein|nr:TonB-dependent receptor [Tannerellaceae bacterium]
MKYSIIWRKGNPQLIRKMKVPVLAIMLGICTAFAASAEITDIPVSQQQQTGEVRGRVVDAQNEPLIGVSIQLKGTGTGTITDMDGNYNLQAPQGGTLVFSYVGYATQEIVVNSQNVSVRLIEDTQTLEEVVVVGYGTQKKSEITAAVSSLKEEDFNMTTAASSALELAMGRIPGLVITNMNQGDPRSSIDIQIRGTSSMRGSNSPLIVIDGVPGGDLSLIPPEDITSINVLKDASAAAIYGTRGSNGVILITTKRGNTGGGEMKSTFEYSSRISHDYIYREPDMLTADEYREYMQSGAYNSGMMHDFGESTDWQGLLTNKNNVSHTHNLAMSGGTRTSNYRASIYYRTFDPIAIESESQNWGARLNVNHLGLNDRLEVQLNFNSDFRERNGVGRNDEWEQAAQRNPTEPSKDENGVWLEDAAYNSVNPLARYSTMDDVTSRGSWLLSSRATLTVIEGLKVSMLASWQQSNETRNQYYERASKTSKDSYAGGGYARKWSEKDVRQVVEFTVDYSKIFNDIHSFNVIAGHGYEYEVEENFDAYNTGFMTDHFQTNNLGAGTGITSGNISYANMASAKRDNRLGSFFGRINYTLQDKYLFSATLRYDGSSRFGENHRWGTFPALSAGWIISQEDFMKDLGFINYLKLRAGYGVTGNMPNSERSDDYSYMITMGTPANTDQRMKYPINGSWQQSYGPVRNPNPNLKWEEKREFNFGLDFSLLKDRIGGTIDIYKRTTVDIIDSYNAPMPPMVLSSILTNVGSMSNRGIEIGLNGKIINKRNFKYDANFTFTYQKNILESLSSDLYKATYKEWQGLPAPGALGNAFRSQEGEPTGQFYGKRFAGFTDEGKWMFYKKDGKAVTLSEILPEDLTYIGNGTPKYQVSLNNTFRYKNFDLSFMFRGKFGFKILNTKEMFFGNLNWLPNNVLKSAITKHTELQDAPQYSDYYLENGNFVKLQNMSLGYNFSLNSKWVRSLRAYASWSNCFTLTGYSGTTPELRDTGFITGYDARGFFPATSSLMFGVNVGF